jgi:heptosyltransferase-2
MPAVPDPDRIARVLIVMPTWLGDTVMATPTLRALRGLYPKARITALVRRNLKPLIESTRWVDRILTVRPSAPGRVTASERVLPLSARLRAGRFDLAVLLPNSFRSALLARLAGIPRRVGYERDGRGFLLTDRLDPPRSGSHFIPICTRDYYLRLARYLGAAEPDPAMHLFTRAEDDARADMLLRVAGYDLAGKRPLVLLIPGAHYGDAKLWLPERFAAVADRCAAELGCVVALSGAPEERPILDRVRAAARSPILDLPTLGIDLRLLKSVLKRTSLLIGNDTGPRHMAAALGVPMVTIFGPTDPAWTAINFAHERQVMVSVDCGPCQKKKCPLDHRCMTRIDADMVFARAAELLAVKVGEVNGTGPGGHPGAGPIITGAAN